MIVFAEKLVNEKNAAGYVFGHAGDGNLHVVIAGDPDDDEWSVLEEINRRIVERAVELGGTCTGEHGVGLEKLDSMCGQFQGRPLVDLPHG